MSAFTRRRFLGGAAATASLGAAAALSPRACKRCRAGSRHTGADPFLLFKPDV